MAGRTRTGKRTTHGKTQTKTFAVWWHMRRRCDDPGATEYRNYGGRGITYCERWSQFEAFLEDMGEAPQEMSIDRIDNNKGYSPENCRWATRKQQQRNIRTNRLVTYRGRTQCVAAWSEELGWSKMVLINRLNRGWTIEEAFETPVQKSRHILTFRGETKSLAEWSKEIGLSNCVLRNRLNHGWDVESILTTPLLIGGTHIPAEARRADLDRV